MFYYVEEEPFGIQIDFEYRLYSVYNFRTLFYIQLGYWIYVKHT